MASTSNLLIPSLREGSTKASLRGKILAASSHQPKKIIFSLRLKSRVFFSKSGVRYPSPMNIKKVSGYLKNNMLSRFTRNLRPLIETSLPNVPTIKEFSAGLPLSRRLVMCKTLIFCIFSKYLDRWGER